MLRGFNCVIFGLLAILANVKSDISTCYTLSDGCKIMEMFSNISTCRKIYIPPVDYIRYTNEADILHLTIEDSRIPILSSIRLSNLKYLAVKNSSVETFQADAFGYLYSITVINLDQNLIEVIPNSTFDQQNWLIELYLSNNKIKNITSSIFYKLNSLQKLDLSNNLIKDVPQEVFRYIATLKNLNLANNKIKTLDRNTFSLSRDLRILNLQGNSIEEIKIGSFSSNELIEEINLSWNNLSAFTENALAENINIKRIDLSHNKIKTIKSNNYGNGLLDLSHNLIEKISPNAFNTSKNLKFLDISNNRLKYFRDTQLSGLNNLEVLNASRNKLVHVFAESFSSLLNVKLIDLSYNDITELEEEVFKSNVKLITLNIANNDIRNVNFLKYLCRVVNLNMSRSLFDSVYGNQVLGNLTDSQNCSTEPEYHLKIESLDLSYNNLRLMDISLLKNASSLKKLYFEDNNLVYLNIEFLSNGGLPELQEIGLDQNNWNCLVIESALRLFLRKEIAFPVKSTRSSPYLSHRSGIECFEYPKLIKSAELF